MSKDIREMIDKVKNLKSLNENLSLGNIKTILYNNGIKNISEPESFYDGSGYGEKYVIIDSEKVNGKTPYMGIPTKVNSQGFILKNGELKNFFAWNGSGFDTFTNIDDFLNAVKNV